MISISKSLFIVLYGINNLGKSTQAKLLVDKLNAAGRRAEYLKYTLYDLEPSGPCINDYLRKGNPENFSAREFQILHTMNRTQYQPQLQNKLSRGIDIVAEDYTGTGLAWAQGAGISKEFITRINSHLLKEDLAILLDGQRFLDSVETDHKHETDDELTARVRRLHLELAYEYGWTIIEANQPIAQVANDIWQVVLGLL